MDRKEHRQGKMQDVLSSLQRFYIPLPFGSTFRRNTLLFLGNSHDLEISACQSCFHVRGNFNLRALPVPRFCNFFDEVFNRLIKAKQKLNMCGIL